MIVVLFKNGFLGWVVEKVCRILDEQSWITGYKAENKSEEG